MSSNSVGSSRAFQERNFQRLKLARLPRHESVLPRRRDVSSRRPDGPTCLSLFSGCGGLDLGFRRAGYHCLHAYDIDAASITTYNYNFGPSAATVADLSGDFLSSITVRPDVVIAGPPCQGFSTIGRRDPEDARNHLLLTPVDLALRLKARALLVENVCGVLSGTHARYWNAAIRQLTSAGYVAATLHVAAANAGLPQIRRRVVLVAARCSFNLPTWLASRRELPLRSILDVPEYSANHHPEPLDPASRTGRIAAHVGLGQKLSNARNGVSSVHTWDIPDVFGVVSAQEKEFLEHLLFLRRRRRVRTVGDADPVPYSVLRARFASATGRLVDSLIKKDYVRRCGPSLYDLRRTFNGKFRRLHPDRPAHSVLTQFCDPRHFLYPFADRGFTVREAARLQGFPDSFRFLGSPNQQARQVGNAVPAPLAAALARWIRTELL